MPRPALLRPSALLALVALPLGAARADTVVLANGDEFTGALVSESPESVSIQVDGAVWTLTRDKISAVRHDAATRDRELSQARTKAFERAQRQKQAQTASAKPASSQVRTAGPQAQQAPVQSQVIVYGTSWCGFCRKARSYLQSHGVAFADKDIERDPQAAEEMQRKMAKAGIPLNSGVPVVDVFGTLVLGFDEPAIAALLAQKQ